MAARRAPRVPTEIAIVGGGRWARVLTQVLTDIVPATTRLTVHTMHNASVVASWAEERALRDRVQICTVPPSELNPATSAAVVVNASRDHAETAAALVDAGVATLVEKPLAMSSAAASRLKALSNKRGARLGAAFVLLYARYLWNFKRQLASLGASEIESIDIEWSDPAVETRYGEQKAYDAGVPVFVDVMPHVTSLVHAISDALPASPRLMEVRRGGQDVTIGLRAGTVRCSAFLSRNSEQRRRRILVRGGGTQCTLDFSVEPGVISSASSTTVSDDAWNTGPRPVAAMLEAFLTWAGGGPRDQRLDAAAAVRGCALVDQLHSQYAEQTTTWLIARLTDGQTQRSDVRYAVMERLQASGGPNAGTDIDRVLTGLGHLSAETTYNWARELQQAKEQGAALRALAESSE